MNQDQLNSECGASLTEYAIAIALLVLVLAVVNQNMKESSINRGLEVKESTAQMAPCDGSDSSDIITKHLSNDADVFEICY